LFGEKLIGIQNVKLDEKQIGDARDANTVDNDIHSHGKSPFCFRVDPIYTVILIRSFQRYFNHFGGLNEISIYIYAGLNEEISINISTLF
jgi:hypothetical protein